AAAPTDSFFEGQYDHGKKIFSYLTAQGLFPRPPEELSVLEVGCGGGLLSEELLRAGVSVTGVDLAGGALRHAMLHARSEGVEPRYVQAPAEALPFREKTFAAVLSSDFLEHVQDIRACVQECARVLSPGGVFLYDTINRTWLTRIFHVGVLQKWRKLVPPNTHDWRQFIRPRELEKAMRACGLQPVEKRGLHPAHPIRFALHLLTHRKGRDRMPPFRIVSSTAGSYLGYALK
ncbi:MAG: bifunctional 2-polyprenyl-6-hydroxyphenol methylase/3-demethylubiquinol 3-O-methyltransferase UbiG, partial [Acidobacteriota bacterium]